MSTVDDSPLSFEKYRGNRNRADNGNNESHSSDDDFLMQFVDLGLRPGFLDHFEQILSPIKRNRRHVKQLNCVPRYYEKFSVTAWSRIGHFLGGNDHCHTLNASDCELTDEKLAALLVGLSHNCSVKHLNLESSSFGRDGIASLCSFLEQKKCTLKELNLSFIDLGTSDLSSFVLAMKKSDDIEVLRLVQSLSVVHSSSVASFFRQMDWPMLEELDVRYCSIGVKGCTALGQLLRKPNCYLKKLQLKGNRINDKCCSFLAKALRENEWLETLVLDDNDLISSDGLGHFVDSIYDTRSISRTYDSNVALKNLSIYGLRLVGSDAKKRLKLALKLNTDASRLRLKKVYHAHFKCDIITDFDLGSLLDLDVKLMPNVLSFIGRGLSTFQSNRNNFRILHCIVRRWNMPVLCGFPSAERVRLDSRLAQMESEIATLRLKNKSLEVENSQLHASATEMKQKEAADTTKRKKLKTAERLLREKDNTINELTFLNDEMEARLRKKHKKEKKLKNEIAKLRCEIESLKDEVSLPESSSCTHKRERKG